MIVEWIKTKSVAWTRKSIPHVLMRIFGDVREKSRVDVMGYIIKPLVVRNYTATDPEIHTCTWTYGGCVFHDAYSIIL